MTQTDAVHPLAFPIPLLNALVCLDVDIGVPFEVVMASPVHMFLWQCPL